MKPQVGSETVGTRWKSGSIGKPGRRQAARLHDRVERRGPAAGGPTQVSQRYERTNKEKDPTTNGERVAPQCECSSLINLSDKEVTHCQSLIPTTNGRTNERTNERRNERTNERTNERSIDRALLICMNFSVESGSESATSQVFVT